MRCVLSDSQKDLLSSAQLLKLANDMGFKDAGERLKHLQKVIDAEAAAAGAGAAGAAAGASAGGKPAAAPAAGGKS